MLFRETKRNLFKLESKREKIRENIERNMKGKCKRENLSYFESKRFVYANKREN